MNNHDVKHYYSLNTFLRSRFNCKIAKISINAGFGCPNRDGRISHGGCIFCSEKGSGDFACDNTLSIKDQISQGKAQTAKKWPDAKYIAYFQAYTNTYAPIEVLRQKYYEAIECEDVVGLAIATRPDCLDDDVMELLFEISQKTYLWVELGLQTSNEKTATLINRGYNNSVFEDAVKKLNNLKIDVVVHTIIGLPYETNEDMLNTIKYVSQFNIQGIKLQLLHIIRDTKLHSLYLERPFNILTLEEYSDIVIEALSLLPENIVIHRITGDGPKDLLVEPKWSLNKRNTLNTINNKLSKLHKFQGDLYQKNTIC